MIVGRLRLAVLRWAGRRPVAFGAVGGLCFSVLMALAFAPVGLWPAAFVAVLPLAIVGEAVGALRRGRSWRAALGVWAGVAPWWAYAMVWTARNTQAGYAPLVLVLSAYAAVFVWVYARTRRRFGALPVAFVLPLLWAGFEVIRGEWGFDGYPWYLVAHPLIDGPAWVLTWPAALAGTYLVSALVCLPVAGGIDWFAGRRKAALAVWACVVVWVVLGVAGVLRPAERDSVRLAMVQTNVPQDVRGGWDPGERWTLWERLRDLTLEAVSVEHGDEPVRAVVWPETMFPGAAFEDDAVEVERAASLGWFIDLPGGGQRTLPAWAVREGVLALQESIGVPLIVGAASFEGFAVVEDEEGLRYDWTARRNSVFQVVGGAIDGTVYSKLRLVPFGEVMPYISAWPWLEERLLSFGASGMAFDLSPGDGPVAIELAETDGGGPAVRLATPICFESTVAGVVRRLVYGSPGGRADVIVVLTNDGWFGDWDPGRAHHMQASRWRCVELGVGMARSANTGVSAFVDAEGRVLRSGVEGDERGTRVDGVLVGSVPTYSGSTPFGAWVGLWPANVFGVVGLAALGLAALPVRSGRRSS